jgi:enoyl-CoA hydratase/carnithine racemase
MARFHIERVEHATAIVFDDGGMNLLSSEALWELREIVAGLKAAAPLIFRSGRRNLFAAGADMAEMQHFTPGQAWEFARLGQEVFAAIERLPCVTVAMIDGDCFGGALDLALAFDLRYATPRSRFAHPGARLGIVTGFGGTSRWRNVISRRAANQLFLANRVIDAEGAIAMGLVDGIEPSLARLGALDPATTRFVKELTLHVAGTSRQEALLLARRMA